MNAAKVVDNVVANSNGRIALRKQTNNLDVDFIKKQFFPANSNVKDIEFCIKVAQELNLNPVKREIFFIERKAQVNGQWITRVEPLTSRDGFLSIAHKSGLFAGIKSWTELRNVPKLINGQWNDSTELVAVAEVYRKDTDIPTVVEVEYSEYVQLTKAGAPTKFWAKMPKTMLKKVAESQALRKAFNISGIYAVEEMGIGNSDGGNLSIDETANEEEIVETTAEPTTNNIDDEVKALESIGLKAVVNNGWIKAEGDTFHKKDLLKSLGFQFSQNKKIWIKKVG
jgi:phage recombination protein Bet